MLVFDKPPRMQEVPEVNFNCLQKSNIMNTSNHTKGDADVGLLVACKVQLSSEVIRLKTETLRLQKECNNAQHKGKELDQTVSKLVKKTKDLETQLSQAKEENKHLRLRNVLLDDTKTGSMQRLSQSLDKYNSFPTTLSLSNPTSPRLLGRDSKQDELAVRQVSQEMLQKMKQELKELHEMNCNLGSDQDAKNNEEDQTDCKEELEQSLSSLVSEASSIKHCLLEQRKKLHTLLRDFSKNELKETTSAKQRHPNPNVTNRHSASAAREPHNAARDNLVEPHFNTSDLHAIREPVNAWNFDEDRTIHPSSDDRRENYCIIGEEAVQRVPVLERICPLCHKQFDPKVPQSVFEEHVFDHLDEESKSVVEQFVLL